MATKRARTMTAEDVVDRLDLDDDLDDFDEHMMPGSNDEFSDCDLEDEDENDSDDELNTPLSPTEQASSTVPPPPPLPPDWSSNLTPLTISDFDSPVGPSMPIPETASEVFDLMFTPSLMDMIVEQSNLYAK